MSQPSDAGLVGALEKLPVASAVTYRGLPDDAAALTSTIVTEGLMATSRDPRIATENFAATSLIAVAGRTGRDIAFLAQHSAEAEVVFLPGTILRPVRTVALDDGTTVFVVEELLTDATGPDPALPSSADALIQAVIDTVTASRRADAVPITTPGKFAGPVT